MIDLFADLKYKTDCENKMQYYKMLTLGSINTTIEPYISTFTIQNKQTNDKVYYYTGSSAIFLLKTDNLNIARTIKDMTGKYYNAIKLSANLTKFIPA